MDQSPSASRPKVVPPPSPPEVDAKASVEEIREMFFARDCVLVRGLLNPAKLAFFRRTCERIYSKDDEQFCSGSAHDEDGLRQYKNGWIWEGRLRAATEQAFGYEDIMANKNLYAILTALLGPTWFMGVASQIRRIAPQSETAAWNSHPNYHLDAQWGVDHQFFLNVWAPSLLASNLCWHRRTRSEITVDMIRAYLMSLAVQVGSHRVSITKPLKPRRSKMLFQPNDFGCRNLNVEMLLSSPTGARTVLSRCQT
ncbi:MAG: hypothetical protein M3N08_04715 [Pseudomonadota bacterium]|nr:hypothetical protein [Pseudomonadota bacterium]